MYMDTTSFHVHLRVYVFMFTICLYVCLSDGNNIADCLRVPHLILAPLLGPTCSRIS